MLTSIGIGTLAFALLIGPLCGYTIPLFAVKRATDGTTRGGRRDRDIPHPATGVTPAQA